MTEAGKALLLRYTGGTKGIAIGSYIDGIETEAAALERERLRATFDSMLERGAYLRPPQPGSSSNSTPEPRYWPDLISELLDEPTP